VVSFNAAGHPVVVLNNHKSAYDLLGTSSMLSRKLQFLLNILDGRSSIYSHRPRFIMAGELLCNGIMLSFIPYGDLYVLIL